MIPSALGLLPMRVLKPDDDPHVVVVASQPRTRFVIANALLEAGLRVTTAGTYGLVETLQESDGEFDLLIAAQSEGEMAQFGTPQLARSVQPSLPILVLDFATADGSGLIEAVRDSLQRWPTRERICGRRH